MARIQTPFRMYTQHAALVAAPAAPATDTWNPADKNAGITLSNGNLTATYASGATPSVRSVNSHSTGKYHIEYTVTNNAGNNNLLGLASASLSLATYVGDTTNSYGFNTNRFLYLNGSSDPTGSADWAANTSDVMVQEIDLDGMTFKIMNFTKTSGYSSPISIAALTNGPWFLGCTVTTASAAFTLNSGGSAYSVTPTSGYGNW